MANRTELTRRETFWFEHLRACAKGSLKAYAEAQGLDVQALYQAKARLKRKGALPVAAPARLVRVERAPRSVGEPAYCRVHLANGVAVELSCTPEHWPSLFESLVTLP